MKNFKISDLEDYTIDGADTKDYPDFCDAYLEWGIYEGRELTDEECQWITEEYPEWINEQAFESCL